MSEFDEHAGARQKRKERFCQPEDHPRSRIERRAVLADVLAVEHVYDLGKQRQPAPAVRERTISPHVEPRIDRLASDVAFATERVKVSARFEVALKRKVRPKTIAGRH